MRSPSPCSSADEYLKVHTRGPTQADVTEGSGGIWERLHYDWSDPNHVVLTTTDSISRRLGRARRFTWCVVIVADWPDTKLTALNSQCRDFGRQCRRTHPEQLRGPASAVDLTAALLKGLSYVPPLEFQKLLSGRDAHGVNGFSGRIVHRMLEAETKRSTFGQNDPAFNYVLKFADIPRP